ncbi:MAG: phosphoglucomutase/phosphomannomutase family protein [Chloroflexi bacterium]|nr:MAG: phosphoglucomutase/phosphomannomutase family protein [Chloroflexota bacterium]
MPIHFGTDGWRAVISDEFTFANVRKVAQAIADKTLADARQLSVISEQSPISNHQSPISLVVGFDTRFLSDRYAQTVAEVLAGNGIRVWLTQGDTPTPLVSYAVVDKQAAGGVMITASHNPPRYNGIKLKAAYGGSASPADAAEIERRIRENDSAERPIRSVSMESGEAQGLISRFDPLPTYRTHLHRLVDFDCIRRAGLTVAVDAMYGAGRVYLRDLLSEAGCQVTELRGELNPGFGGAHPEPIARHLQPLFEAMTTGRYRLGLATDGDADRIGAVDPDGRFIDPHSIMALLLEHLVEDRGLRGSVVKTVSTTQMLNRLADHYGLPLHETPVGFNHISDLMLNGSVLLGGEESGGISVLGHIPEGDGVLMGLLLAEMVAKRGKSLSVLLDELMDQPHVGHFRYGRDDQTVTPFDKATLVAGLMGHLPTALAGVPLHHSSDRDGVKYILADNSWLLIRPSGTEPVLRVYAEASTDSQVRALLAEGGQLTGRVLAQMQAGKEPVAAMLVSA